MSNDRATNMNDVRLGQRVRSRRLAIGMSQEKLAAALGVSFQQLQKYERGTNRMACSRLIEVAAALDYPAALFFDGLCSAKGLTLANDAIDASLATAEGAEMAARFARIKSKDVRRQVINIVAAITEAAP